MFALLTQQAAADAEAIFTSTGTTTYTVPAGVVYISAVCIGGGGGSSASGSPGTGPNSGQGGTLAFATLQVTAGETLTITVGAGGTAGQRPGRIRGVMADFPVSVAVARRYCKLPAGRVAQTHRVIRL